jgi:Ser/Thr protein kinase RdoA (MazF antagonist)
VERVVVGEGRTAEVLTWGEGRVLKLYREGFRREGAANEARVTRLVHEAGLAAPAVFDGSGPDGLVDMEDRAGIVYERINGVSMLREMAQRPWRLRSYCRTFARLHAEMHATRIPALPSQRVGILRSIDRAAGIAGAGLAERARRQLQTLPDSDVVCHGDFHPDNILMSRRGPVIVDWEPVRSGAAAADVARTVILARYGGFPPGAPPSVRAVMAVARRLFLRLYLRDYFAQTGMTWPEVRSWIGVMAVARLSDQIEEEASIVRRAAARYLSPGSQP